MYVINKLKEILNLFSELLQKELQQMTLTLQHLEHTKSINGHYLFVGKEFCRTVAKYPISEHDALLLMEVAIQKRIVEGY